MFSLPPWLAWTVIAAVVAGWLATTIASLLIDTVEVPASLNGVFLLVAGLVADDLRRNAEQRKKGEQHKPEAERAQNTEIGSKEATPQ